MSVTVTHEGVTPIFSAGPKRHDSKRFAQPESGPDETTEIWGAEVFDAGLRVLTDVNDAVSAIGGDGHSVVKVATRSIHSAYETIQISRTSEVANLVLLVRNQPIEAAASDDASAVDTIRNLSRRFGVSEKAIYEAAGIKRRTYLYWKRNPGTTPRAGSQGSLWSLVSAVEDLTQRLPPSVSLSKWLRDRPERLAALKEGQFRRFVDEYLRLLAVDPISTAHSAEALYVEDEPDASPESPRGATQARPLADDTPTKVVLD